MPTLRSLSPDSDSNSENVSLSSDDIILFFDETACNTTEDADRLVEQIVTYQSALVGLGLSKQRLAQLAMERLNMLEEEHVKDVRENRRLVIEQRNHTREYEQSERRHKDKMDAAKEDPEWVIKLFKFRDKTFVSCTNSVALALACCFVAGLGFQTRDLYQGGIGGVYSSIHEHLSQQCTNASLPSVVGGGSWMAYTHQILGGVQPRRVRFDCQVRFRNMLRSLWIRVHPHARHDGGLVLLHETLPSGTIGHLVRVGLWAFGIPRCARRRCRRRLPTDNGAHLVHLRDLQVKPQRWHGKSNGNDAYIRGPGRCQHDLLIHFMARGRCLLGMAWRRHRKHVHVHARHVLAHPRHVLALPKIRKAYKIKINTTAYGSRSIYF
jgi:hypothetical protein